MNNFFKQLLQYILLVIALSVAAVVLPQIAPAGWMTQAVGVLIWLAALVIGSRAISWGARVYVDEIAPRTKSDLDSPFLVSTVRNLALVIFFFVIAGGIATTINNEFDTSFFAGGVGFAISLGLAPVVGAYILDVRRASIIDKAVNEGDYIEVGDVTGYVKGQDAYFLEILQMPELRNVKLDHHTVFGRFEVLERFEEITYDLNAIGAEIKGDANGYHYSYSSKDGKPQTVEIPFTTGVAGQKITQFDKAIGYYRVIGDPLITLELDADGAIAAENPQALLDAMQEWYAEFPDSMFDKTYQLKMHNDIYIDVSSLNGGAAVPARMIVRARSYQIVPDARRVAQTILALKAYAGGWGYGTTSNLTIGNAADFRG